MKRGGTTLRNIGLAMLIAGIFPWAYTPFLIRDRGMEGSGMLGTVIFIFIGLPGLFLFLLSFFFD